MALVNVRRTRLAALAGGLLAALSLVAVVVYASSRPGDEAAASGKGGLVYLTTASLLAQERLGELDAESVTSPGEVAARIEEGSAWGVMVDPSSAAALEQRQLEDWFRAGIAIFGVGMAPIEVFELIGGDAAFADLAEGLLPGVPKPGSELRHAGSLRPATVFAARTSSAVYAETGCYTLAGGTRYLDEPWTRETLDGIRLAARALTRERDGSLSLACEVGSPPES